MQTSLIDDVQPRAEIDPSSLSHKEAVQIAARWLRNRCNVVLPEFTTLNCREIPDVLGFSARDSHMIEVKVSRGDFLSDNKKPFRFDESRGMGNYRYYCCPRRMIGPLEVPDGWGLIYIFPSGKARIMMHPDRKEANLDAERSLLYSYAHRAVIKGFHQDILKTMAEDAEAISQATPQGQEE